MTEICHIYLLNLGVAGKITHLRDEWDCRPRHNSPQDIARRYDGRCSGGADFHRSEEALLRRVRWASAAGRGDRTFAGRGAFRGVLRLDAGSSEWLDDARLGRGDGWRG